MSDERRTPAREDVCRNAPFTLVRADSEEGDDGLTIEGYGAVFNSVTEINSWEGTFEEVLVPGAFKKSLRERTPKMQFDHGHHPLLGSLPLGRWTVAEEDERGLHLVGRLTDNWLVQPFRDAIKDGGVEGMSFRFSVVKEEWADKDGKRIKEEELWDLLWRGAGDRGPLRRTLKEVKATEAGPVVWPAYEDTTVGVRSADAGQVVIDLGRLGEAGQRRQLAEAVALADAMSGLSPDAEALRGSLLARGIDPRQATRIAALDGAAKPSEPNAQHDGEPRATARTADDHSDETQRVHAPAPSEPVVTVGTAGEHSAPDRPVNPYTRRDQIRSEYRKRVTHLLAVSPKNNSDAEKVGH